LTDPAGELARRRRELEALQAIALASNRGLDVRGVLDAAVEVLHRAYRAELTTFYRFESDRDRLVLELHRGLDVAHIPRIGEIVVGRGLSGIAAKTRRPVMTHDYDTDPRALIPLPRFKGVMAAPVLAGDELLGVVTLGSTEAIYDAEDLAVLGSIGAQLGTALDNARLVERLRVSEARYRTFVEAMPYAVYESTPSGELLYVSPKIQELTGYALARFAAEPGFFGTIVHPEDRAARTAKLLALGKPGARVTLEYRLVHANGVDIVWVSDQAQARAARGAGSAPVVVTGVLVDLRERKLMEAAAREHARLASLGELAAGVAHEVNNPLSGVLSYAQLAKRLLEPGVSKQPLAERLAEPLDGIMAEAERILEITRTLVSFARRPEKEAFRPLHAHELVHASLTIMKQRLKENSIALEVDIPEDLPPLRARGHELTQVLQNLITNARQALNARFPRWDPAKRLSFRARRVDPDAASPQGYVRIDVEDKGCGIPATELSRVFVPFFTTKPQGTGLGLAIAREIVIAHGGHMGVVSEPGSGTTFSFTIPVFA
jgi:PAS domain S-box-containing protein